MQNKFLVDQALKKFGLGKMGYGWKHERQDLFDAKSRPIGNRPRTLEEIAADVPDGVVQEQWQRYVEWKAGALGQERSERGVAARAALEVKHTPGSRPFAVHIQEMVSF